MKRDERECMSGREALSPSVCHAVNKQRELV